LAALLIHQGLAPLARHGLDVVRGDTVHLRSVRGFSIARIASDHSVRG
jgi:hypothetical protein